MPKRSWARPPRSSLARGLDPTPDRALLSRGYALSLLGVDLLDVLLAAGIDGLDALLGHGRQRRHRLLGRHGSAGKAEEQNERQERGAHGRQDSPLRTTDASLRPRKPIPGRGFPGSICREG